jgi:RNA polymerase sigma-70 factor (ECF subfamily)
VNETKDDYLVTASLGGDREAFAGLVRRHSRRIYAVCMSILGNEADSEDIAQETLIRGFSRLDTLRRGESFGPWIANIARNLCRDHIRVNKRRRVLLGGRAQEPQKTVGDFSILHAALARLPEKHRSPLLLYYFDGKSAAKLAGELGISEAGACTRLSRARRELRRIMERQAKRR